MDDILYSVEEVAAKINVHPRSIRRYIASGELNGIRDGKKWVVRQGDLTVFINDRNPAMRSRNSGIKEDDLCIFMDRVPHHPNCRMMITSVIDVKAESSDELKELIVDLQSVVALKEHAHCVNSKFDYVYQAKGKKMRFVLWGAPAFIAQAMMVFGEHINACE